MGSSGGPQLFWRLSERDDLAILAASIGATDPLETPESIFVADEGVDCAITDGRPPFAGDGRPVA